MNNPRKKPLTKAFLQRLHDRMVKEGHPEPALVDVSTWVLDCGCKTEQDVLDWIEPGT